MKIDCTDFHTLYDAITYDRWTPVFIGTMHYNHKEVTMWLNDHCEKRVKFHAAGFAFEDEQEALIFKLVWRHIK